MTNNTGYSILKHDLTERFFEYDLTKRQQRILLFIFRLTAGCQKETAYIPRLNYFQGAGIHKSIIGQELKQLEEARVILWDKAERLFSINANFSEWQIRKAPTFSEEELANVIKQQLQPDFKPRKKVNKTSNNNIEDTQQTVNKTLTNEEEVNKTLTFENEEVNKTLTNEEEKVNETLTNGSIKHRTLDATKPGGATDEPASKDIFKDIYKDKDNIKAAKNNTAGLEMQEGFSKVFTFFDDNIKPLNNYYREKVNAWIDDHGTDLTLHVFRHALNETKDQRATLKFIDKIFQRIQEKGIDTVEAFLNAEKEREAERNAAIRQKQHGGRGRVEKLPDWLEEQKQEEAGQEVPASDLDDKEAEALRERLKRNQERRKAERERREREKEAALYNRYEQPAEGAAQ